MNDAFPLDEGALPIVLNEAEFVLPVRFVVLPFQPGTNSDFRVTPGR